MNHRGKYLSYYIGLSLKELRRRQWLTANQIVVAHKNAVAKQYGWQNYERALIRLQRIHHLLSAAVELTQF